MSDRRKVPDDLIAEAASHGLWHDIEAMEHGNAWSRRLGHPSSWRLDDGGMTIWDGRFYVRDKDGNWATPLAQHYIAQGIGASSPEPSSARTTAESPVPRPGEACAQTEVEVPCCDTPEYSEEEIKRLGKEHEQTWLDAGDRYHFAFRRSVSFMDGIRKGLSLRGSLEERGIKPQAR